MNQSECTRERPLQQGPIEGLGAGPKAPVGSRGLNLRVPTVKALLSSGRAVRLRKLRDVCLSGCGAELLAWLRADFGVAGKRDRLGEVERVPEGRPPGRLAAGERSGLSTRNWFPALCGRSPKARHPDGAGRRFLRRACRLCAGPGRSEPRRSQWPRLREVDGSGAGVGAARQLSSSEAASVTDIRQPRSGQMMPPPVFSCKGTALLSGHAFCELLGVTVREALSLMS